MLYRVSKKNLLSSFCRLVHRIIDRVKRSHNLSGCWCVRPLVFPAVSRSPIHCFDLVARDNLCLLFRSDSWLLSAVVERRDLDSILNLCIDHRLVWFFQKKLDGTKVYHIFRICCIFKKRIERLLILRRSLSWKISCIMRGSVVSVRYWEILRK